MHLFAYLMYSFLPVQLFPACLSSFCFSSNAAVLWFSDVAGAEQSGRRAIRGNQQVASHIGGKTDWDVSRGDRGSLHMRDVYIREICIYTYM